MNLWLGARITALNQHASASQHPRNARRTHAAFELTLTLFLLSVCFATVPAWARQVSQASPGEIIDSLPTPHSFGDVAISPDGQRVAWTSGPEIFVTDLQKPASKPQMLAPGSDVAWSPDSRRLAFLSDAGSKGQQQLSVVDAAGVKINTLTNLTGALADPQWSPDGKALALLFEENAHERPGVYDWSPGSQVGVIHEQSGTQVLAMVDSTSGRVRMVSPPGLYVYEHNWSPSSREIVVSASYGPGDDNHYVAQLYTINLESGKTTSILKPDMQITAPQWSPDGKQIAFIGGLIAGFGGGHNGDVYLIPAAGGVAHNITPQLKASARGLRWLSAHRLLFQEWVHGNAGFGEVDLAQGTVRQVWTDAALSAEGVTVGHFSIASDGTTSALALQTSTRPQEIWAGPLGAWRPITDINHGLRPTWGKVESLDWTSDGWSIQGWLCYPANYDSHRQYPMVVSIHGGPTAATTPGWGPDPTTLSLAGYFVLLPNYVGSAGEGEAFKKGIVKNVGYADLRSILAGVNKVADTLPIDRKRIGIYGWSNGGYLTMWAVTQTDVFHAGIAGAGISDWFSYAGQTGIPQWTLPYFGARVYDDPSIYARSSPMTYIKNVKTPTLILVGDRDGPCPAAQSLEFWSALRTLGVPTKLVIYPGEGHEFRKRENRRDVTIRRIEWFNEYLK
jgi:dipeptidyl aminopeptidase/acylaminoacyl peptidase